MKTKENLTNIEKNDTIETPAAAAKNAGVLKIKKKILLIIIISGLCLFFSPVFAASTTLENIDFSTEINSNNLKSLSIGNFKTEQLDSNQDTCAGIVKISQTIGGDHWSIGSLNDYYAGQTFLVTGFDTLTKINIWTSWRTAKSNGDCVLYVYNTLPNLKPDYTSVIGSASLPCSDITAEYPLFSATAYIFSPALTVENGKLYAFSLRQEPLDDTGESWTGSSIYSDPYADGILYGKYGNNTGEDASFLVYGCTAPIPPPPPKMVCATSTFLSMYNDINFITGCTEHYSSSTAAGADWVEYHYYSLPFNLFLYLAIIFIICLAVISLFLKHYGQYSKKNITANKYDSTK